VVEVHGIDEWLTAVASAAAVGITSEATRDQSPRPGIRYRPPATPHQSPCGSPGGPTTHQRRPPPFDNSSARSTATPGSSAKAYKNRLRTAMVSPLRSAVLDVRSLYGNPR
jgi:hypothetical protein